MVTPTSYGKGDTRLKSELEAAVGEVIYNTTGKPLSSRDVARLLPGIDAYIAGLDQIDHAALEGADRLKVICRYGVGVDNVDLAAAHEKGILVTNTPGANSASVAELALGLMLALARQIPQGDAAARRGEFPRMAGISLEEKTIGILGLGAIGKQLAQRLRGFNCRVVAYDPYPDAGFAAANQVTFLPLTEVLAVADFLSLHLPLLPETRQMVNPAFLAQMKRRAFLINTARGDLVDETALAQALRTGWLGGAGLDALLEEPPSRDNPLLAFPNLIVTPHLGAQTDGATANMGWWALNDCLAVLRGEKPRYPVS